MPAIDIHVPAELFALAESSHFEGAYDFGVLVAGPDEYRFEKPCRWSVDITNTGEGLLVAGSVEGNASCDCARCLEEARYAIKGEVDGFFLFEEPAGAEDAEDWDSLGYALLPESHVIDIEPLLRAAVLVDLPDMPLCRDDCKGLCQRCGANLNEGPCGCGPDPDAAAFDEAANPFSVLRNLDFE
jgi:uncharacterized protein